VNRAPVRLAGRARPRAPRVLTRGALALVAACLSSARPAGAQRTVGPVTPPRPAGSELSVYLMTMGQGDYVWERYGHNAIGVRDARTGADIVYNWGTFSFSEPGFLARFIRGDMRYWLAPYDAAPSIVEYVTLNRTVTIQELNLSPAQRLAMLEFVRWNAMEENRYYHYDYFGDNCSTRVRDALDRVLGGALRQATEPVLTTTSYRDHALRLMAEDFWISLGIDIGLGRPADRPITEWEEMFIPMRVRDHVRRLRVPDDSGRAVPLVTSERVVFEATRAPERVTPPRRARWYLAASLVLAVAVGRAATRGRGGHRVARRLALSGVVLWSAVAGLLGVLLLFLRLGTRHQWAYDNSNLFFINPLWLLIAVLVPLSAWRTSWAGARDLTARIAMLLTVLGVLVPVIPAFRQDNLAVVLLVVPMHAVAVWALRHLTAAPRAAAPPA
jgi:hypothetical protein